MEQDPGAPWTQGNPGLVHIRVVTKPYKFIGFGAMDVTKPSKITGFAQI